MPHPNFRVVKVGGSLLDWPRLADQLRKWLAAQPAAKNVVLVGGGKFADEVRRLDGIHHLSPRDAHWLAAETMQITAKFLAIQLTGSDGLTRFEELSSAGNSNFDLDRAAILDSLDFLLNVEPRLPGHRLAQDWTVTSDSISARVAEALDASELVLLKSALPTIQHGGTTLEELAASEYVDAAVPRFAAGLKHIRCVNLRDDAFAECRAAPS